jgi:hypothetical protein
MYHAPSYFEQNVGRYAVDVSVVDDRFATEPMTAVQPAEQQVSEEELHRFFEQAMSDRVQAISACLHRVRGPLTPGPYTAGYRRYAGSVEVVPSTEPLRHRGSAGLWPSLLSNPWQRGIILASLTLLLLMSGFDLMGVLVLGMR